MVKTTIDPEHMTPDLLRGVESASRWLADRFSALEAFHIAALWRCVLRDEGRKLILLDLVARHEGREYGVHDFRFAIEPFLDPTVMKIPVPWDLIDRFIDELYRLNLEDLKAQQARAAAYDHAGAI